MFFVFLFYITKKPWSAKKSGGLIHATTKMMSGKLKSKSTTNEIHTFSFSQTNPLTNEPYTYARYNDDISPDISNLNPILSKPHGLWKGSYEVYDGNFDPAEPKPAIVGLYPQGPRPYAPNGEAFFNITIAGTRWEQHDIYVLGPAPQSFCDANPNIPGAPFSNVGDDGVCGENGSAYVADAFKTSTHEKNDILIGVSGTGSYLVGPSEANTFAWTMIPSGAEQLVVRNSLKDDARDLIDNLFSASSFM